MIAPGDRVPGVEVWLAPRERVRLDELTPPGEAFLLVFYLFDWSGT